MLTGYERHIFYKGAMFTHRLHKGIWKLTLTDFDDGVHFYRCSNGLVGYAHSWEVIPLDDLPIYTTSGESVLQLIPS